MLHQIKTKLAKRGNLRFLNTFPSIPRANVVSMMFDLHLPQRSTIGKLHYHCQEPVVFLHGVFGSKSLYRNDLQQLADILQTSIYAVDIRNHGNTENGLPFDYETLSNDLEYFIDSHALKKPSLIGYSLGAKIGMLTILKKPYKYSSAVFIDNAPLKQPKLIPFLTAFSKSLNTLVIDSNISKHDADWIHKATTWIQKEVPSKNIADYLVKNVSNKDSMIKSWYNSPTKGSLYAKIPIHSLAEEFNKEVPMWPENLVAGIKTDIPVCFIKASDSGFIEEEGVQAIKKYFTNFTIKEIKGTHLITFERPQEYINTVVNWFKAKNTNLKLHI